MWAASGVVSDAALYFSGPDCCPGVCVIGVAQQFHRQETTVPSVGNCRFFVWEQSFHRYVAAINNSPFILEPKGYVA